MKFCWFYIPHYFLSSTSALLLPPPLVSTLAGTTSSGNTNGVGTNARFTNPDRCSISPDGTVYLVADFSNHLLRKIIISTSTVSTLAGRAGVSGSTNGEGTNALFKNPSSISYSPDGSYALVTDYNNNLIRKIIISTAQVTKIAGGGSSGTSSGSVNGVGTNALFYQHTASSFSPDGSAAIVADAWNHMIRMIIISTSVVSTLAGQTTTGSNNGIGTNAMFNRPYGVDYYPDGSAILVADKTNNMIRKIIISTSEVSTLAGTATSGSTNGIGTNSRLNGPNDICISSDGLYALLVDSTNNRIRSIILSNSFVDTLIGTTTSGATNGIGTNALLNSPHGIAISPNGNYFVISDGQNQLIRYVELQNIPTIAPTIQPTTRPSLPPSFAPTYSVAPTNIPSTHPTDLPSTSPTFSPTESPTTPPPTSCPTSQPSSIPTITFQPTAICPPGYFMKIEDDPTSCTMCKEGFYSTNGMENSCHACAPWTWNIDHGNTDCPYSTARNSASDLYPIAFCALYVLLSLACFILIVSIGQSCTVFLNILLITTDQVTDILYAWYSLFSNPYLLYLSAFFCITNLLFPLIYLLWHLSFENSLMIQCLRKCSEAYYQYDLTHGHYGENEHPRYSGWIFHSIHGCSLGELGPFSIIFLVIDLLWILLRLFIMLLLALISIPCQFILLLIGVIFYASKLMSIPLVEIWFWSLWNSSYLDSHPHLTRDDSPVVYNTLVLVEVCSECIPQITIQLLNTMLMSEKWTILTMLSVAVSGSMIISVIHHFWYKHRKLIRSKDPTYTSFDFKRIPKYNLYEKFSIAVTNRRLQSSNIHGVEMQVWSISSSSLPLISLLSSLPLLFSYLILDRKCKL